tara:strand:- start:112 stop:309 length:198 start_codon:yes stop_codon:yes gene_type:complete
MVQWIRSDKTMIKIKTQYSCWPGLVSRKKLFTHLSHGKLTLSITSEYYDENREENNFLADSALWK